MSFRLMGDALPCYAVGSGFTVEPYLHFLSKGTIFLKSHGYEAGSRV